MNFNSARLGFFLMLSAAVACGDDTSGSGGGGGSTSASGGVTRASTGVTGSASVSTSSGVTTGATSASSTASSSVTSGSTSSGGGPTVDYVITIKDIQSMALLPNLSVCHHGTGNCVMTNAMGVATIAIPMGVDFTLNYGGGEYRQHLLRVRSGTASPLFTRAMSNGTATIIFALAGVADDPTKGSMGGLVTDGMNTTADATASLMPNSGVGPIYTNDGGIPQTSLTKTSTTGTYLMLNVDPGNPRVQVAKPGVSCLPDIGVQGNPANTTVVPVEAGAFTVVSAFDCM